jgi:PAS domain S-box-containing protein
MQQAAVALIHKLQRSINIAHNPVSGWVVLALSLLLTFAAYGFTSAQVRTRAEEHFLFRTQEIVLRIHERLSIYDQAIQGGQGLFSASHHVSRTEWQHYVTALDLAKRLPGIQGLGFAQALPSAEAVTQLEAEVQAEGYTEFRLHPQGERDFYSAIVYLEPFNWRNRRAFGYDMWASPERREAMARARDTGEPSATGAVTLVQETERNVQHGFLIYIPVYTTPQVPETVELRRSGLRGWVYAPFRMGDLMAGVLGGHDDDIVYEVHDGTEPLPSAMLLESKGRYDELMNSRVPVFSRTLEMEHFGRIWTLRFAAPQKSLIHSQEAQQPLYILIAGIAVDLLLFYVIVCLHLINRHARRTDLKLQRDFAANQERLEQQTRLVEAMEREAQVFFELTPGALLVVSQRGIIIKANHYAHDLFRFSEGAMVGLRVEALMPPAMAEGLASKRDSFWRNYFENPVDRVIELPEAATFRRNNGEEFPTSMSIMPVDIRGEMHVVVALHDLSQQKQIEKTLADAKEKAEGASRAKSEFVANMSHEIRTPLNAVLGAAQLLEKTTPNGMQQKYIRMIRSSGEALLGVINDILDFSKIEAGRMELTQVHFNLDDMLTRVAVMMSVTAGEKDLELAVRVDPQVRRQVVGDPVRLQQVLINLVSNAIKFTEHGEIVLSLEVESGDEEGRQGLRFAVRDTGIGMSLLQQTRIFNAFSQADASITRRFGGTGLGLVISNRLVELMGGRLQVLSELGLGSEFSFVVTLSTVAEAVPAAPEWSGGQAGHLLLVDSHPETHRSVQAIADGWGWRLTCCESLETVEQLPAAERTWNFALISGRQLDPHAQEVESRLARLQLPATCARILLLSNHQRALHFLSRDQRAFGASLAKPVLANGLAHALLEAEAHLRDTAAGIEMPDRVAAGGPLQGVHLLLVEDNAFNQTVAQGILEDLGARATLANQGAEALELMRAQGKTFDLVLMDIQMPVMDGLTATRTLREEGFNLPIIAMTAGVSAAERAQCLEAGMNDLIPKPIDSQQLQQVLLRWLAQVPQTLAQESRMPPPAQVFNAARLEKLARGRRERMLSLLESLGGIEVEASDSLELAEVQWVSGDLSAAAKTLHRIKGLVANYGGEQFAQGAQVLEQALRDGSAPEVVEIALVEVRRQLVEYLDQTRYWCQLQKQRLAQVG